jgi:hypothetical protein
MKKVTPLRVGVLEVSAHHSILGGCLCGEFLHSKGVIYVIIDKKFQTNIPMIFNEYL